MARKSGDWTFLSNHGHVLIALSTAPDARIRDIAEMVGLTERAIHRLLRDMESGGIITRKRRGRRVTYSIDRDRRLRHPIESHRTVGDLVSIFERQLEAARLPAEDRRSRA